MLDKTSAKAAAEALEPMLNKVRGTVYDMLDSASAEARKLQRTLFGVLRVCQNPDTAASVLHGLEKAWRTDKTVVIDGTKTVPTIPRSYSATKSALLKAWAEAPSYANAVRTHLVYTCTRSGEDIAKVMPKHMGEDPDQFLRLMSDRYSGERGDTLFMRDFAFAKGADAGNKKRDAEDKRAVETKEATARAVAFASGTDENPPDALSEKVGAALNKLVLTVRNAAKVIPQTELADYLNDMAKDVAKWADDCRKSAEPAEVAKTA